MKPDSGWTYFHVTVVKIVDGDTLDLAIDLGFGVTVVHRFRLLGVDAPEVRGPSKADGLTAKRALVEFLRSGILSITTYKVDKYGRFLANVFASDGILVNQRLVDGGFARDAPEFTLP